jgi:hypothetical protein
LDVGYELELGSTGSHLHVFSNLQTPVKQQLGLLRKQFVDAGKSRVVVFGPAAVIQAPEPQSPPGSSHFLHTCLPTPKEDAL